ncbi:MAG: hypothetical protein JW827_04975, partial [Spirochaetes bacterium]|nr:hypothetical protein [Spirochaetota bacterium]
MKNIKPSQIKLLICPACQGKLDHKKDLFCKTCKITYPVIDNIPVLHHESSISPDDRMSMQRTREHYDKDSFNIDITERKSYYLQDNILFGRFIKSMKGKNYSLISDIGCGVGTLSKIIKETLRPTT